MNSQKKEKTIQVALLALCIFTITVMLGVFFALTYTGRITLCGQDMYCDELVARLIWEDKSIFPANWAFGNQYNVISTPVMMALFYGLTGSMNLSLVLGCAAMNAFVLLAFWWALRPFCSKLQISVGLMVLLGCIICKNAPLQYEGQFLYIMANYYACYLMVLLVVWGDWARLLLQKRSRLVSPSFLIAVLLSFLIGMQSMRQFLMMVLPMACLEALRLLVLLCRQRFRLQKEQLAPTLAGAIYGIANLLGYIYVKSLHLPGTSIYGNVEMRPVSEWKEMLPHMLQNVSLITGLHDLRVNGMQPLSVLLLVFALCMVGAALLIILVDFIRSKVLFSNIAQLFVLLGTISFAGMMATNIVLSMKVRSIYFFVWHFLVAFSTLTVFIRLKPKAKPILAVAACVLVLNNMLYSYVPSIHFNSGAEKSTLEQVSDWVVENEYDYLYGSWGSANMVAPYGDGAYITGTWFWGVFNILPYTNVTQIYTEEHNKRAVYLITEDEEEAAQELAAQAGAELTLQASFGEGSMKLYTSSKQLLR